MNNGTSTCRRHYELVVAANLGGGKPTNSIYQGGIASNTSKGPRIKVQPLVINEVAPECYT